LSKPLASPFISQDKGSVVKKKLPLKDSESSDLKKVLTIVSLAHPAHLRLTKKNQRIRIRAPLSSPMEKKKNSAGEKKD
jgi:predicted RNA-binding protein with PUA domain